MNGSLLSFSVNLRVLDPQTQHWRRASIVVRHYKDQLVDMATITIGKLVYFDENVETWEAYPERLEQYFIANSIEGDKKSPSIPKCNRSKCLCTIVNFGSPSQTF